jgi:hypothetical protein
MKNVLYDFFSDLLSYPQERKLFNDLIFLTR